jgi:Domain of unknown function (DUF4845)
MSDRLTAQRQRGVTAIGWILLLAPVFVLGYMAMRAIPPYNNYLAVVRALDNFAKDHQGSGAAMTKDQIKDYLSRKWTTEYIDQPRIEDLAMKREGGGWSIEADYEQVIPLFYNVSLLFQFQKKVEFN